MTLLLDPRWGVTLGLPLRNEAGDPIAERQDDLRQTPDVPASACLAVVATEQASQSVAAIGTVLAAAITGTVATEQGSQSTAVLGLVDGNIDIDTHDGGKRRRKPIIDVKAGWEPIYGLKTRKRKRPDEIETAPLVVASAPDIIDERAARLRREDEEVLLLLAA